MPQAPSSKQVELQRTRVTDRRSGRRQGTCRALRHRKRQQAVTSCDCWSSVCAVAYRY